MIDPNFHAVRPSTSRQAEHLKQGKERTNADPLPAADLAPVLHRRLVLADLVLADLVAPAFA